MVAWLKRHNRDERKSKIDFFMEYGFGTRIIGFDKLLNTIKPLLDLFFDLNKYCASTSKKSFKWVFVIKSLTMRGGYKTKGWGGD
jgi:hypothetical protein